MLTGKQKHILEYIEKQISKNGIAPTHREIAARFRLSSVATVHEHLQALQEKGYLNKRRGQARGMSPRIHADKLVYIPLLGTISAGEPIEVIERGRESIGIPKSRFPQSREVYALRVQGDSMIDEGVNDGDTILIHRQDTAENGDKVVALVNGNEATLKTFYKEKGHIRLQPANKNYEPLIIESDQDIAIQGVLLDVIEHPNDEWLEEITTSIEKRAEKKLPLNKIILGDAVQELKKLPNESCDVIIIDPPYNIGKDFGNNIDKREIGEYVAWCKSWINESVRVLKPAGTMFIYGFSEILAYLSIEVPIQKRWLIWHYTNKNMASLNFWQRSHESIICAWKEKPLFNRDEIREPYTEGFLNGAAGKIRKGTPGRFSRGLVGKETVYKAHEGGALPRDVIKIPALAGGAGMVERWFLCKTCDDIFESRKFEEHQRHETIKHPTQKPFELSRRLMRSAMPKKDGVVLVPFVGTGSECKIAKELGYSYLGFEINPDYVKMAEKFVRGK